MKSIVLVGYMCAGKTTIGKYLAQQLGKMFYDLDWYIETRYRMKVSEIFAQKGEEKFRQMERNMLHEVAEFENIILSCGGGTPCYYDNMEYLNKVAEVVYLKASPHIILEHLKLSKGIRPLLVGKTPEEIETFVTQQLKEREHFYMQAPYIVDINILDSFSKIDEISKSIIEALA